jgi:hypothetical protein
MERVEIQTRSRTAGLNGWRSNIGLTRLDPGRLMAVAKVRWYTLAALTGWT